MHDEPQSDFKTSLSDANRSKQDDKLAQPILPKRFYEHVEVASVSGNAPGALNQFSVSLDGKTLNTPGRAKLLLSTRALAEAVADEWRQQAEVIDARTMPLTRIANTSIDGVIPNRSAVMAEIAGFAMSDLLCYRADGPRELVQLQDCTWTPVLNWAEQTFGIEFKTVSGVMPVVQDSGVETRISQHLESVHAMTLAPLHVFTTLTGSAVLALAIKCGHLDTETAWSAAHIDEDWQIKQWGPDAEAAARREVRWQEMQDAGRFLDLLNI